MKITEDKLDSLYDQLRPTILSVTKRRIKMFFHRLGRVLGSLKMIWNNEDWDADYLLILMHWKMKRLHTAISAGDRHVGCEKTMKKLNTCILILQRLIDGNENNVYNNCIREIIYDFGEKGLTRTGKASQSRDVGKLHSACEVHTWKLFNKIFEKNCRKWWD